jgi:mono/diheme cytochrome c family protein
MSILPRVLLSTVLVSGLALNAESRRPVARAAQGGNALSAAAQRSLIAEYCVGCHNDRGKAGGLSLADFDPATAHERPQISEKIIRKLRAGMMPPPSAPRRPAGDSVAALVATLEARMDATASTRPNPGRRTFQRLNRAEYKQAIRDLLDLEIDVGGFLPEDTVSGGFDNVADAQSFSPTLMQGYLRAASDISRLAVGDVHATAVPVTHRIPKTAGQLRHVEGAPIGTRGGTSFVHVFPADGLYAFTLAFFGAGSGELFGGTTITSTDRGEQIEISVNGAPVARFALDGWMHESDPNGLTLRTEPIPVRAGPQRVSAAFIQRYAGPNDDLLSPYDFTIADPRIGLGYGITTLPHLRDVTITGPQRVTGISETPSRRRVFTCRPAKASDERACAFAIINRLAAQAFRGAASRTDLEDLMRLYARERTNGSFESGIRLALQAVLAHPQFLFRLERTPVGTVNAGESYRIDDVDLASRLSFFLWGSVPDAELLRVANRGELGKPAELARQVRRLIADARSIALSTRFAHQWLRLQDVDKVIPDPLSFPHYDNYLAESFVKETELFFDNLVREDRSLHELMTADYSFVNERLARHYGIANVMGNAFRRVEMPAERRGILGHGSILMQTSVADRTSPVLRGKWIMEVLLGSPPPPPPPNVPELGATSPTRDGRLLTTRERMEQHRASPACNSCHRVIDPPGLALENFDVTGRWRVKDHGVPISASGELYDGSALDGPDGLRAALLKHADLVALSFTEHLLTYALGRRVEPYDMPTVRAIVRAAAQQDNRLSAFILGLVQSAAFQMSTAPLSKADAAGGAADERLRR